MARPPPLLLQLLLAALLVVAVSSALVDECVSGEVFRRDCNLCVCPASGIRGLSTCTSHSCGGQLLRRRRRDLQALSRRKRWENAAPGNGERCSPNVRYMEDCNQCICSADGIKAHSSCTFLHCPNKPR